MFIFTSSKKIYKSFVRPQLGYDDILYDNPTNKS